jgi:hypothetical protein
MEPKSQSRLAAEPSSPTPDRRQTLINRERALAALADRQYGVVARRQMRALGIGSEGIKSRLRSGRLRALHRGVYTLGHGPLPLRARWMAAVLAQGDGTLLSHGSAAALWGLIGPRRGPIDVTSLRGRSGRRGIAVHSGRVAPEERALEDRIPVTSVARTLVDIAGAWDEARLRRAFEEADRLRLLDLRALERACDRAKGRRGLRNLRPMVAEARAPASPRSPLENRFLEFHRDRLGDLPEPATNVLLLGHEVDALWAKQRLAVEMDSWEFHGHRAAFERDRRRDSARQAAGFRVVRLTHRRLTNEPATVAAELRRLLA